MVVLARNANVATGAAGFADAVETMVHGSDPNWGRVTMAIGKCQDDLDIEPERVRIAFGGLNSN